MRGSVQTADQISRARRRGGAAACPKTALWVERALRADSALWVERVLRADSALWVERVLRADSALWVERSRKASNALDRGMPASTKRWSGIPTTAG